MNPTTLPFVIALLASLVPIAGALLDTNVYHVPAALVVGGILIVANSTRRAFGVNHRSIIWVMGCLTGVLIAQVFTGRGYVTLAAGGYVMGFAFLFDILFLSGPTATAAVIVRGISRLYQFFLLVLTAEAIVVFMGYQPALVEFFAATGSPGYKNYNPADFLRFLGVLKDAGGLNSIFLGSQIAGMLCIFSTTWFLSVGRLAKLGVPANGWPWAIFSIALLVLTVNGTNLLLLATALLIYALFVNSRNRILTLSATAATLAGLYVAIANGYVMTRVFNDDSLHQPASLTDVTSQYRIDRELEGMTTLDYYLYEFYNPIELWLSLSPVNKLLGVGAQFLRDQTVYISGDFGYGAALLATGALWMATMSIAICVLCIPLLRRQVNGPPERQLWSAIGSANALIALLWLFSTIHYNQAFGNPGAMTLFALHLAVTIYCRQCLGVARPLTAANRRPARSVVAAPVVPAVPNRNLSIDRGAPASRWSTRRPQGTAMRSR